MSEAHNVTFLTKWRLVVLHATSAFRCRCPITMDIFVDPVTSPTGTNYERAALADHLRRNSTDPKTRRPLRIEECKPNHEYVLRQDVLALRLFCVTLYTKRFTCCRS